MGIPFDSTNQCEYFKHVYKTDNQQHQCS
jgi:hypothetical protein